MNHKLYQNLSHSPVFKGMNPEEIKEILDKVQHRVRVFKKGSVIALRGDRCEKLMVLLKGTVRGEMVDFDGKAIEVETISAPRTVAPAFVFGKNNVFPVDVLANQQTTILILPKYSLINLIQLDRKILNNFLNMISDRTHFLSERLRFMSFKTIKEKFAFYILSLIKEGDQQVTLPKNQQELSEFFGVARPSLSRVVAEMERDKIIVYKRKKILIKDIQRLNEIIKE
jgi:CRP-like cAMP-binding protein